MATVNTKIEWTEATWNPVTGCTKISEGCPRRHFPQMINRLVAEWLEKSLGVVIPEWGYPRSECYFCLLLTEYGLLYPNRPWSIETLRRIRYYNNHSVPNTYLKIEVIS
jgi:protein gp37